MSRWQDQRSRQCTGSIARRRVTAHEIFATGRRRQVQNCGFPSSQHGRQSRRGISDANQNNCIDEYVIGSDSRAPTAVETRSSAQREKGLSRPAQSNSGLLASITGQEYELFSSVRDGHMASADRRRTWLPRCFARQQRSYATENCSVGGPGSIRATHVCDEALDSVWVEDHFLVKPNALPLGPESDLGEYTQSPRSAGPAFEG